MSSTKVARHRAACRPSTPLSLAAKAVLSSDNGRRVSALAGSGVALTVIAAGAIPTGAMHEKQIAATKSIDSAKVVRATVKNIETNPVVVNENTSSAILVTASVDAKQGSADSQKKTIKSNQDYGSLPASVSGNRILQIARQYLGTPYHFGGTGKAGIDCSGLVQAAYGQAGISLPHSSGAIGKMGHRIPVSAAQPGDILWKPGHVALYVGNGMILHAPKPGDHVRIAPIYSGFSHAVRF